MSIDFETPTYNLRAVVQETGLKADTLRAWERRYGLPVPKRSEGGHRLYSRRDIEILKWLVARVAEGLTISRAVELWRKLEDAGEDPVAEHLERSIGAPQQILDAGSTLDEIREAWIAASLRFDEQSADAVLSQAFAIFPVETVTHQILLRAMSEIGDKWFSGEIGVEQEHFISQLTLKRLGALLVAAPTPTRSEKIIVACPPGEEHTISLLLLTLGLRRMGFQVFYFGADTPTTQLEQAVTKIKPNLVISFSQWLATSHGVVTLANSLFNQGIPFAYGGRIFNLVPELRNKVPGHFLGDSLDGVYGQIENIVTTPYSIDFDQPSPNPYLHLSEIFQKHQSEILRQVMGSLAAESIPEEIIEEFFNHLHNSVHSALKIGDLSLISFDLDWLGELLDNRSINSSIAENILGAFNNATREILGEAYAGVFMELAQFLEHNSKGSSS